MRKFVLLILLCVLYVIALCSCPAEYPETGEYHNSSNSQLMYGNLTASHKYAAGSEGVYYCEKDAVYYIPAENTGNKTCILTASEELPGIHTIFLYHGQLYLCDQEDNTFRRYDIESETLETLQICLPENRLISDYYVVDHTLVVTYAYWEGITCVDLESLECTHYDNVWGQTAYADGKLYVLGSTLTVIDRKDGSVTQAELISEDHPQYVPKKLFTDSQNHIYLVMEDRLSLQEKLFLMDSDTFALHEITEISADRFLFESGEDIYYTTDSCIYRMDMETRQTESVMNQPEGYLFSVGKYLCSENGEGITIHIP